MALKITNADVWAGEIRDQPGGLDRVLSVLAEAGADLECVIARRQHDRPGTGVVLVTPIKGRKVQEAARMAGLHPADDVATLRLEGPDRPGLGHLLTQAVVDAGVNMRGLTATTMGNKFVAFVSFDDPSAADKASRALRAIGKRRARATASA